MTKRTLLILLGVVALALLGQTTLWPAANVEFDDAETLQGKFDADEIGHPAAGINNELFSSDGSGGVKVRTNPSNCSTKEYARGIDEKGVAEGCRLLIEPDAVLPNAGEVCIADGSPDHDCTWGPMTGGGIPGLIDNTGNEDTLNYLLAQTAFASFPNATAARTTYYVSSDPGGSYVQGADNSSTPENPATPLRSICAADLIAETTCDIHLIFDSGGGEDVWSVLAGELDCENGDQWDGGLGPPPDGCGDSIENPTMIISGSDPSNRFQWDLNLLTEEQTFESCDITNDPDPSSDTNAANCGGGTNGCDCDNDTVFAGRNENGNTDGWTAVQSSWLHHYPPMPRSSANGSLGRQQKQVVGGNIISLNLKYEGMIGTKYSSQHGGFDISINPEITARPASDFNQSCVPATASPFGCADDDDYSQTQQCVAGLPYSYCQAADGQFRINQNFFLSATGGTILISNKAYDIHENEATGSLIYGSFATGNNGSELIVMGPMDLYYRSFSENPPWPGNGSDIPRRDNTWAFQWETGWTNPVTREENGVMVAAFINMHEAWPGMEATFRQKRNNSGGTGDKGFDINLWEIYAEQLGYYVTQWDRKSTATEDASLHLDCSTIEGAYALGYGYESSESSGSTPGKMDVAIRDSNIVDYTGPAAKALGYLYGNVIPNSLAEYRGFVNAQASVSCAEDVTCNTGFLDNGFEDQSVSRAIDAPPQKRPGCTQQLAFKMPDNADASPTACGGGQCDNPLDGWIPAFVLGDSPTASIRDWCFGQGCP